ncbi:hypothetical protein ABEB36_000186 [Hypothenemus hampei]|uniref:Uncharacterized protein n=1 Tax=Hypothenemus hampei TaxID=57062 RepID=A0ABD1FAG9_HYPHA
MDSFEDPSFNSDIADESLDLSLNSPANSTHTAPTTPRGDGTSKNKHLSKERSSDQVQPHTNLNSKHSELNPPTTRYVDMTENRGIEIEEELERPRNVKKVNLTVRRVTLLAGGLLSLSYPCAAIRKNR